MKIYARLDSERVRVGERLDGRRVGSLCQNSVVRFVFQD